MVGAEASIEGVGDTGGYVTVKDKYSRRENIYELPEYVKTK